MQAAGGGVIAHHLNRVVAFAHLAHGRGAGVFIHHAADSFHPAKVLGLVL